MTPIITRLPIGLEYINIDNSINTDIEYNVDTSTGDIYTIDSEFINMNNDSTAYSLNIYTTNSNDIIYEYVQMVGTGRVEQYTDDDGNNWENCRAIPECGFTKYSDANVISIIIGGDIYCYDYICTYNKTLKSIYLIAENSLKGRSLFHNDTKLSTIEIGSKITTIGDNVFQMCTALNSIIIPESVDTIGGYVFYSCTALESVYIYGSISGSLGDNIFYGCKSLNYLYIDNCPGNFPGSSYTSSTYTKSPFYNCGNNLTVEIGDVDDIMNYAFYRNENLVNFIINGYCNGVNAYAFAQCSNLESFSFSSLYEYINENAFNYCDSLKEAKFNDNISYIGDNAFQDCTALKTISLGNNLTSIGESAFADCTSLVSVDLSNITEIPTSMFEECTNLTYVILNDNTTSIGDAAFYDCNLLSINMPTWLKTIGIEAFGCCDKLTYIDFTYSSTTFNIYNYAFIYCTGLKSVLISGDIGSIATHAFDNCTQSDLIITIDTEEDVIEGSPWGATNATIVWKG